VKDSATLGKALDRIKRSTAIKASVPFSLFSRRLFDLRNSVVVVVVVVLVVLFAISASSTSLVTH